MIALHDEGEQLSRSHRFAGLEARDDARERGLDGRLDVEGDVEDEEVEELLAEVLESGDGGGANGEPDAVNSAGERGNADPYEFLPTDYEPGETEADARITFVFQVDDGGADEEPRAAYDAQVEIADRVDEWFDDAFVFGEGLRTRRRRTPSATASRSSRPSRWCSSSAFSQSRIETSSTS